MRMRPPSKALPPGTAGPSRPAAPRLHPRVSGEGDVQVDTDRRALGALRCEAIALHAGGCSDSHAAGLLDLPRPVVGGLRRAR